MARRGVCTGWLHQKTQAMQKQVDTEVKGQDDGKSVTGQDIEGDMASLSISQEHKVIISSCQSYRFVGK